MKNKLLVTMILSLFTGFACAQTDYSEYEKRRQTLMEQMEEGVAIFSASEDLGSKAGADYEYRQGSDFYYLTGFPESNALFLLIPEGEDQFILFVQPSYPGEKMWVGDRYGMEEAVTVFGADKAYSIYQLRELLGEYLEQKKNIYISPEYRELKEMVLGIIGEMEMDIHPRFINPLPLVHEMRLFKSPPEIETMKRAIDITCEGLRNAYRICKPGMCEYAIEAIIEYTYRKNGAQRPGFPSIVGSGPNATILHYEANSREMEDGDLLLMDVGAEFNRYTADVTRTIPVNGTFSKEQREIYELVLKGQKEAIKWMKPGKRVLEGHIKATEIILAGLYELGLMTDPDSEWQRRFYILYPASHWLGLDVHDAGDYGWRGSGFPLFDERGLGRKLEPGMVLTIEPGVYLPEDGLEMLKKRSGTEIPEEELKVFIEKIEPVYKKYVNIGVRIEDDILITEKGNEILSEAAPKEVEEIERMMREKSPQMEQF